MTHIDPNGIDAGRAALERRGARARLRRVRGELLQGTAVFADAEGAEPVGVRAAVVLSTVSKNRVGGFMRRTGGNMTGAGTGRLGWLT